MEDDDEKKDPEEAVKELQEEIQKEGTKGAEDTFAVLPAKGAVVFIINSLPGKDSTALAMQLPPSLAIQLGNALIQAAIATTNIEGDGEVVEEVQSAYSNDPNKKEWVN